MAVEPLKGGGCDGGTEFLIVSNFDEFYLSLCNFYVYPVD